MPNIFDEIIASELEAEEPVVVLDPLDDPEDKQEEQEIRKEEIFLDFLEQWADAE